MDQLQNGHFLLMIGGGKKMTWSDPPIGDEKKSHELNPLGGWRKKVTWNDPPLAMKIKWLELPH
jgi:hypothetical protein